MISPELQLTSIQNHCERLGYEIVETLQDLDLSGRFWKRRQVEQAVKMIETKQAEVIVVWKISRVARNRTDWAIAVDRVEGVGGRLESSTEPMDTTTSSGRFARGMLAELAVFESERIGDTWKETHARRVKNGLPHHGLPRFGYSYTKQGGYVPHEGEAPVLRQMYRRYIAGASMRELGAYAASEGFTPENGWLDSGIRHILDRGFGAGYIWSKGAHVPGAHEAVITEREWLEYRVKRDERAARSTGGLNNGTVYPYSGMLRCYCGAKMDGGVVKRNGRAFRRYTCRDGLTKGTHAKVSVSEPYVEDAVLAWLEGVAAAIDARAATVEKPKASPTGRSAAQLNANLQKNIARMDSLTMKFIDGDIPSESYQRLTDSLTEEKLFLEARLRLLEVNSTVQPTVIVPHLVEHWAKMSERAKREVLGKLVARIQLHDWPGGEKTGRRPIIVLEHDWETE